MRIDGRNHEELRPLRITRSYLKNPEGSVLIELGDNLLICTATVEDKVPQFLQGQGQGWITAEYAMLPRSNEKRVDRERGKINARSLEIQRLIGRSLRAAVDLSALGERTITLDCDVIQADGGTRIAAISGAFVALAEAFFNLVTGNIIESFPYYDYLSAVSVGILDGNPVLDLAYEEDSRADVDMNVVMTASGKLVEVQGTAEKKSFSRKQLDLMLDLAETGIRQITKCQQEALGIDITAKIESSTFFGGTTGTGGAGC